MGLKREELLRGLREIETEHSWEDAYRRHLSIENLLMGYIDDEEIKASVDAINKRFYGEPTRSQ